MFAWSSFCSNWLVLSHTGSIHTGDQIWISRLKKGGIAYRTGMLNCGDILLGINGISLEHVNLNQAAEMLKSSGERVALKVSKENGKLALQMEPGWYYTDMYGVAVGHWQTEYCYPVLTQHLGDVDCWNGSLNTWRCCVYSAKHLFCNAKDCCDNEVIMSKFLPHTKTMSDQPLRTGVIM